MARLGRSSFRLVAALLVASCAMAPAAEIPDLADTLRPQPEPRLPAEFDAFAPPIKDTAPAAAAPQIGEWSRSCAADQTMVLAGAGLTHLEGDAAGSDCRFIVFGQTTPENGVFKPAVIQTIDPFQAAITIAADIPSPSMYIIWPRTSKGVGRPVAVNRTEPWWIGPARAAAGEAVSVYGRNLAHDGGSKKSWVYLAQENKRGTWAKVTAVNPYKVDFLVPDGLALGDYEVWVHNGHGGHFGWGTPSSGDGGKLATKTLQVSQPAKWSGPTINVRDHGAKGDGRSDDSPAIAEALGVAHRSGRATVYFPTGTYVLSQPITLADTPGKAGLRLLGDGKTKTVLKAAPGYLPDALITLVGNHLAIENMKIRFDSLPTKANKKYLLRSLKYPDGLTMAGVALDAEYSNTLALGGRTNVLMVDCDIAGRECQVATAKNVRIDRCNFYGRADTGVMLYWYGGWNISVTRCTAQHFNRDNPDSYETALGRFFTVSRYGNRHENVYIGGNRTFDMAVREAFYDQNQGEQIMWEFIDVEGQGRCVSATDTTVTLDATIPGDRIAWYTDAVVVAGRGVGQARQIVECDVTKRRARIFRPWRVVPDATSTVVITKQINRVVVHNNQLDGRPRSYQSKKHIASTGVQSFGAAHTLIVDGNTFHELRAGIITFGLAGKRGGLSPNFFHLYTGNKFDHVRWAIDNRGGTDKIAKDQGQSLLGIVARGNSIRHAALVGYRFDAHRDGPHPVASTNVIEANHIADSPVAISLGRRPASRGITNTVIRHNRLSRGTAPGEQSTGIRLASPERPVLVENRIDDFGERVEFVQGSR